MGFRVVNYVDFRHLIPEIDTRVLVRFFFLVVLLRFC